MKKNIFLVSIIFLLVSITYFVKEKDLFKTNKLFTDRELDSFQKIIIDERILVKKQNRWEYSKDTLGIDQKKMAHLLDILKHIETQDILPENPNLQPLYHLEFYQDKLQKTFKILQFSNITGRMTIEFDQLYYRAVLGHSTDGLFQSELNLQSRLFSELSYYLKEKENLFKDNYFYPSPEVIKNLTIKDLLTIDLVTKSTSPAPLEGLKYKKNLEQEIQKILNKLQITDYLKDEIVFKDKISWIKLNNKEWLTLYGKADQSQGAFLYDHFLKKKFKIDQGRADVFFIKPSYFWSLQPIAEEILENLSEASLVLSQKDQSVKLDIPNTQNFELKIPDGVSINQKSITELFKLLLALEPFEQAYKVSKLEIRGKNFDKKLKIELANKKFAFWIGSGLINLLDLEENLVFSYVDNGSLFNSDEIDHFLEQ